MINSILLPIHYGLLLLFGVALSASFAGVRHSKRNLLIFIALSTLCGAVQLLLYFTHSEELVWLLYPLITHIPIVLLLRFYFRKRIVTAMAAVATAYLCCQPANWFGLLIHWLTKSDTADRITQILVLFLVGAAALTWFAPCLAELYQKDNRSTLIFGLVPMVYYLFDYTASIYTNLWLSNNRTVIEFLPFLLCAVHLLFCIVYFREYERKNDAERKEQIIRLTVEQQTKELESIRRSEQEIRILRHDMRLFLSDLSRCMAEDQAAAQKMISTYSSQVEATAIHRYCENTIINCILSGCAANCKEEQITFSAKVEISSLSVDEVLFSTILSNALDNALHAQEGLPYEKRSIKVLLKTSGGRLLLSVKNTYHKPPIFVDDMPVANKIGHGYGTKSIRYMAERLGGNCQFIVEDQLFILRVAI